MGKIVVIQEWWEKGRGQKKVNQAESIPAMHLREAKVARETKPSYGSALDEQKAMRDMSYYRENTIKLVA